MKFIEKENAISYESPETHVDLWTVAQLRNCLLLIKSSETETENSCI